VQAKKKQVDERSRFYNQTDHRIEKGQMPKYEGVKWKSKQRKTTAGHNSCLCTEISAALNHRRGEQLRSDKSGSPNRKSVEAERKPNVGLGCRISFTKTKAWPSYLEETQKRSGRRNPDKTRRKKIGGGGPSPQ